MIGAGLFVSSSAAIAATGPAIVISYLITGTLYCWGMLGEMALTVPTVRSFTEFARVGLGNWGGFPPAGCTGTLDDRRTGGGDRGPTPHADHAAAGLVDAHGR